MKTQDNFHVLGIVKNSGTRDQLLNILNEMPEITCKVVLGDLDTARKEIGNDKHNSVVLLEIEKKDQDVAATLNSFRKICGGRTPFMIISKGFEHERMLRLLRLGVSDFLSLPLDINETVESVLRVVEKNYGSDNSSQKSDIITFAHASGGMGATTLAVNAATIINEACSGRSASCLLDFDLQFGGASIHLDLPGYSPVMDLLDKPERLDREMLEGMMMHHNSGLKVLTTPEAPLPVEAISSDVVDKLLNLAQKRYPYIIVDMPQTMTMWTDSVFQKSKIIYVVTQLNVPAIRQLKRWFSVLEQESLQGLPVKIIVNRHSSFGRLRNDNITIAQASEALGRKIDYMISNDYELISASLDQGMPAAILKPNSKFVQGLREMLSQSVDEVNVVKKGLFSRAR
ncbi:MAG: hypothetical protein KAJ29_03010 [Alphaproteobacteria bacterium]|nr:hypothetical protein [Alphaproteobacteria bacterium]